MAHITKPPRHLDRAHLERRTPPPEPLPTREEVRRELGWVLVAAERQAQAERDR